MKPSTGSGKRNARRIRAIKERSPDRRELQQTGSTEADRYYDRSFRWCGVLDSLLFGCPIPPGGGKGVSDAFAGIEYAVGFLVVIIIVALVIAFALGAWIF